LREQVLQHEGAVAEFSKGDGQILVQAEKSLKPVVVLLAESRIQK